MDIPEPVSMPLLMRVQIFLNYITMLSAALGDMTKKIIGLACHKKNFTCIVYALVTTEIMNMDWWACNNVDNTPEWKEMGVDITGETQGSINLEPT